MHYLLLIPSYLHIFPRPHILFPSVILFQVANIGGWTSASHLLEAGLGGDKLVFKVLSWYLPNAYFL